MEMESSSPLAAIHRPRLPQPWERKDPFRVPRTSATANSGFGLREQMHKPNLSFFNVKDVRGSSPAASLAADLSQNFRLDAEASPRFATPRRNLFSAANMAAEPRHMSTPEIHSSSPLTVEEMMEASPILQPVKTADSSVVEITSPTPLQTPNVDDEDDTGDDDEMMLDSPAPISRKPSLEGARAPLAERRLSVRRPSLSRMKGYTTTMVHPRGSGAMENQLPPFRFGADSRLAHKGSASSLAENFEFPASQEKRPGSSSSSSGIAALRSRGPISNFGGLNGSRNGSPITGHVRRPSNPLYRSRRNFRRTLSMFEHPEDIMRPKAEAPAPVGNVLEAVMDVEEKGQDAILPHFSADDPGDSIPRITKDTLLDVLDGKYSSRYDQKMIIDCRFEYEYEGGHIDGAVNYNDKELLASHLFRNPMDGRTLIIFHCEYSAHRAPMMARHIRSQDRTVNAERYPTLTYPDVYILSGGYSEFYSVHRCRCYPQNYVEMSDENHQRTCERELSRLKARKQPTLGRAKTFAFETSIGDSPTAMASKSSRDDAMMASPVPNPRRLITL